MPSRLDKVRAQEAKLREELNRLKGQRRKEERKADTRRKILIGAAVLAKVKTGEWSEQDLMDLLDGFLTREADRVLFKFLPESEHPQVEKRDKVESLRKGQKNARGKAPARENIPKKTVKKTTTKTSARKGLPEAPFEDSDLASEFNV